MDEQSIIVTGTVPEGVSIATTMVTERAEALESSALIGKVEDAASQERAVASQGKLLTVIRAVERARKAVKEPVLALGKEIDRKAKEFIAELDAEGMRVAGLINEFQEKERMRLQSEARLQESALTRLEREENERIACASTLEEQDAVRSEFAAKRNLVTSAPLDPIPQARNQISKPDWYVTITDIHLLYRVHPNCVKLEPLLLEIKALLAIGVTLRGVTARQIVKSTVRTAQKTQPAIEANRLCDGTKND
jgi:hypothetical protein